VHRGFPTPPDVSADLGVCARVPAVIASSGVKSLLDVPATMELLETLGIPVLGYGVDTLPLFYAAEGGPPVSARVEAPPRSRGSPTHTGVSVGTPSSVGAPPDESLDVDRADRGDRRPRPTTAGVAGQAVTPVRPRRAPRALRR
jgi:pseudouridine-5'-phosphate glycosidase